MRNRAKCKLCKTVIESLHPVDLVSCKCGEISIDGGTMALKAFAKNWGNFLRIDDDDKEINVTVKDSPNPPEKKNHFFGHPNKSRKNEVVDMFNDIVETFENLPPQALNTYVTHYDLLSVMLVLAEFFKEDCKDDNCPIKSLNPDNVSGLTDIS